MKLQSSSQQDPQTTRSTASIAVGTGETGQDRCLKVSVGTGVCAHSIVPLTMFMSLLCCFQEPVCCGGTQTSCSPLRKHRLLFPPLHPHPAPLSLLANPPPHVTCPSLNLWVKLRMMVSQVRCLSVPPPGSTGETTDLEIPCDVQVVCSPNVIKETSPLSAFKCGTMSTWTHDKLFRL